MCGNLKLEFLEISIIKIMVYFQAVVSCSKKKFQFTVQGDAIEFLSWILNAMHLGLKTSKKKNTIISKCFRGCMKIYSTKVSNFDFFIYLINLLVIMFNKCFFSKFYLYLFMLFQILDFASWNRRRREEKTIRNRRISRKDGRESIFIFNLWFTSATFV